MLVALISDIHANLAALEAVLDDLPPVDRIICCGDLVGYYDRPNEVCALLRDRQIECIRGNHDAYVTGALPPNETKRPFYRTDWTREVMSQSHLDWLASLGTDLVLEGNADDWRLRVRHASPWDEETYLHADAESALARLHIGTREALAVGHTHRPLYRAIDVGWLLNPGSVGQPRDWNPLAAYAVFDMNTGAVEHRRAAYDVAGLQRRLDSNGWAPEIVGVLSRMRPEGPA